MINYRVIDHLVTPETIYRLNTQDHYNLLRPCILCNQITPNRIVFSRHTKRNTIVDDKIDPCCSLHCAHQIVQQQQQ